MFVLRVTVFLVVAALGLAFFTTQAQTIICTGLNESFFTCTNMCPITCANRNAPSHPRCPRCGSPGCQCNTGYIRNSQGVCVLPEDCDTP